MFEKFTERAVKVMGLARHEALRLNSEFIGTEHVLLGIHQEGDGVAAKVLKNLQVDLKRILQEIEKLITPSTDPTMKLGQLPFSPRVRRVIELASNASRQLGHDVIGTEHLLLGLLKEDEGIAAQILINIGLKLDQVRSRILEVMGEKDPEVGEQDPEVPWSARTRSVAKRAVAEAVRLGSRSVDPEHVLLGILSENGPGAGLLSAAGITPEVVRKLIPPA